MDLEKEKKEVEEVIIEEIDDEVDDDAFLESLESLDEEKSEEERKKEEEELKIKNKNAEEARKRREAEAKKVEEEARLEKERLEQEELNKKTKEEEESKAKKEEGKSPQEQVKDLVSKYPDINLKELDSNEDFQDYLQGKWVSGGKSITEIYENFVVFKSRISKQPKEEVEKQYKKNSTPAIKNKSGGGGGGNDDVFTIEEMEKIAEKMPFMNSKQYAEIESKLERSIKHHKK